jgi:hypothetical protein
MEQVREELTILVGENGEGAASTGGWGSEATRKVLRETPGVQEPCAVGGRQVMRQLWRACVKMKDGEAEVVQRAEKQRYFGMMRAAWQRRGLKAMRRVLQQGMKGPVLEVTPEDAVEHSRMAGAQGDEEMSEHEMKTCREDMPLTEAVINARVNMVRPLTRAEVATVFKRRNKHKVALEHGHRLYDLAVDETGGRKDIVEIFRVLWDEKLRLAMKGIWVEWEGQHLAAACLLWKGKVKVPKRQAIAYRIITISADLAVKEDKLWSMRCEEMCRQVGLLQSVQITRAGLVGTQMALMTMDNRVRQAVAEKANVAAVSFDVFNFYPEVRRQVQKRIMQAFHLHEAVVGMILSWHCKGTRVSLVMGGVPSEEFELPGMRQGLTSAVLCGRLVVEYLAYPVIRDNSGYFSVHDGADAADAITDDLIVWSGGPGMTWAQVEADLKGLVALITDRFTAARLQFGAAKVKALAVAHEGQERVWPTGGVEVQTTEGIELVEWLAPGEVLEYAGGKFLFGKENGEWSDEGHVKTAIQIMQKVYEEISGPEVPLKGGEQALRMSASGKLWYLAVVLRHNEEVEKKMDSIMCTMVQAVWRLPGVVAHTVITLPHSKHGLGMPMPSREVRARRWGVLMAVWRCKHADMKTRLEGWCEEARRRLQVQKGPQVVEPHDGSRGFMGWKVEDDGMWRRMDTGEIWTAVLRDATEMDFHIVKGHVERVEKWSERMDEEWVVQLGDTWVDEAGKQLIHGTEVKKRMQQRFVEWDVQVASEQAWASKLVGEAFLDEKLSTWWRAGGCDRLSEAEVRWAAQAWAGCAPCGENMWRWKLWRTRGCVLCGVGGRSGWRWADINHVLSSCGFGLRGRGDGRSGTLYGARHSGSKVLKGGVKLLAHACARQELGWTVYTEAEPCRKAPFADKVGNIKLAHSRPDIFLVNNTDPDAQDKKVMIIDLGYTMESAAAFDRVRRTKKKVYAKMKRELERRGGCGGEKGGVQVWGVPIGVKGGIPAEWKQMCKQIGLSATETSALGKQVSGNAISDGKVVAGVWMQAAEQKQRSNKGKA